VNFRHVLVTGGAGFIGSHTVDALIERGCKVRVFDNLEPQVHGGRETPPPYLNPEAEFIRGDVCDRAALLRALDGIDAVIHDAAMVGVGQSNYQVHRYTSVNVTGTATLLDLILTEKTAVERVLVASSMSIYGEGLYRRPSDGALVAPPPRPEAQMAAGDYSVRDPQTGEALEPVPTPETKPLHCTTIYALNKKDQEEYTLVAGRLHGLSTVALRFFNVYGPRQSLSNPYTGAAAIFLSRLKNGNRPLVYEDGGQSRDFVSVRDVADAKLFVLNTPAAVHDVYNVCSGVPTGIADLARLLARLVGRPDLEPEIVGKFRAGDIRHCYGDGSKLAALGWRPRTPLDEGLRGLAEWSAREEAIDRVENAHRELIERGLVRG
jgi:dTDP-L-rhamnose 4-epimerase